MIIDEFTFKDLKKFLLNVSLEHLTPNIGNVNNQDISVKEDSSKATKFDLIIEKLLLDYFKNLGISSFLAEESYPLTLIDQNEYITIDPIDGTRNFINGINKIAIMISYIKSEKLIFSIIFNPITNDFYHLYKSKLYKNFIIHNIDFPEKHIGYINDRNKEKLSKYINNYELLRKSNCIGYDLIEILEGNRTFLNINKGKCWDIFPVIGILESIGLNKIPQETIKFNFSMSESSFFYYAKI
ncbi:MAG: hypothetical protein CMI90_06920 [Pelagibacteraceae bacterium]|nr:hypothetical protein [Pelagibacteraceae bacterium]|tara:strand:- start:578 stop:1300 length:723 start_codon:yes stop_codon:yes gene_type:complete